MTEAKPREDAPVLVLFRHDLRIADNGALAAAAGSGSPVLPVFIFEDRTKDGRPIGGASRWWLHHSLAALSASLEKLGVPLVIRRGSCASIVDDLIADTGAWAVFWNRRYDPAGMETDKAMKASLRGRAIRAESFDGHLLHEPSRLQTKTGGYYKVYTPFWKAMTAGPEPRAPIDAPNALVPWRHTIRSDKLDDLGLLPSRPDWAGGLRATWTPGETGAHARLAEFIDDGLRGYAEYRDFPGRENVSRLSPHLAHGEITPYQVFAALERHTGDDAAKYRKEIGWREFSYHILFHNPDLRRASFQPAFEDFPWQGDADALAAWQRGQTGYPIVDAGMRELWQTGFMHNRVRMIVASFLIKDLLIDWRKGEEWFWDTLVDADPANNPASWQWVAGSGADAAPYFRVFNPVLQGRKFDGDGAYVRTYVPELARLPDEHLHSPWEAPARVLDEAGVRLGETYPRPMVDHARARDRVLDIWKSIKGER